jgi:hypothetical protein
MPAARHVAAVLAASALLLLPTVAAADPAPSTTWFSLINPTHHQPTGMTVVIVPAAFFSYSAMVTNASWIGAEALYREAGVQAALEATLYWAWAIDQYESTHPQLARLTYTVKVLGYDATPADLAGADIVINTAMVADPAFFLFHLGVGLPTVSDWLVEDGVFEDGQSAGQDVCTVWNTGLGQESGSLGAIRLRNLIIHEFGHCLGVGHTGTSLDLDHCNRNGTCYTSHPTDVMSQVVGNTRQCISNLNVQSIAEGYAWATTPTAIWQTHDGETYMARTAYQTKCMPAALNRV